VDKEINEGFGVGATSSTTTKCVSTMIYNNSQWNGFSKEISEDDHYHSETIELVRIQGLTNLPERARSISIVRDSTDLQIQFTENSAIRRQL
jgi:hypothetical protein